MLENQEIRITDDILQHPSILLL